MLSSVFLFAIQLLSFSLVAAAGHSTRPGCVQKCWDNTQYVSPDCNGSTSCLCDDNEYQNSVYQCLYSQCHTAQFANALHHTLAICSAEKKTNKDAPQIHVPALIRQGDLRKKKRQNAVQSVTQSASVGRPTQSVSRSVAQSVTRSVGTPQASVSASAYLPGNQRRAFPQNPAQPTARA